MKTWVLGIEYQGTNYHGWQVQYDASTVQAEVEKVLSKIMEYDVKIQCAGRTDKGVHAINQVVSFPFKVDRPDAAFLLGANSYLPKDIKVTFVKKINEGFDARFSALAREYVYVIYNNKTRPAILNDNLTWVYKPLDENLMHDAAQSLIGEHDFSSFRSSSCQSKTPFRRIEFIKVTRKGNLVITHIRGNAFLHNMVRNIMGVLIDVGKEKHSLDFVKKVLDAKDRTKGSITAPPEGLYFYKVIYPEKYNIPFQQDSGIFTTLGIC